VHIIYLLFITTLSLLCLNLRRDLHLVPLTPPSSISAVSLQPRRDISCLRDLPLTFGPHHHCHITATPRHIVCGLGNPKHITSSSTIQDISNPSTSCSLQPTSTSHSVVQAWISFSETSVCPAIDRRTVQLSVLQPAVSPNSTISPWPTRPPRLLLVTQPHNVLP